jgi:hypothetical protein
MKTLLSAFRLLLLAWFFGIAGVVNTSGLVVDSININGSLLTFEVSGTSQYGTSAELQFWASSSPNPDLFHPGYELCEAPCIDNVVVSRGMTMPPSGIYYIVVVAARREYGGSGPWIPITGWTCLPRFGLGVPTGSLTVTITPASAISAGAKWFVDGGLWLDSGVTLFSLPPGNHTIGYVNVGGFARPPNQTVAIYAGQTTRATAAYSLLNQNCSVSVSASPAGGGQVTGGGTFPYQTFVTVSAIPNQGYSFVSWTENGSLMSTSPQYTFQLVNNRNLIANFLQFEPASFASTGTPYLNGVLTNTVVLGPGSFLAGAFPYLVRNQNVTPGQVVTVVGLVNGAGQCVGDYPQVVYDGTPSVSGDSGSAVWGSLAVPSVGGTYKLRFQAFLNIDPAVCLSQFYTNAPRSDRGDMQGLVATVTVPATYPWTLWLENTNGWAALWQMDGTNACSFQQSRVGTSPASPGWNVVGAADFDRNGSTDLLWQHTNGSVAVWLLDGANRISQTRVGSGPAGLGWRVGATGDLDGDGWVDILWQHTSGATAVWFLNGTNCVTVNRLNAPTVTGGWRMVATADVNGDGHLDILWENASGATAVWLMNGTNWLGSARLNAPSAGPGWHVVGNADIYQQGSTDLLWQNDNGGIAYWLMGGTNRVDAGRLNPSQMDTAWRIVGPR